MQPCFILVISVLHVCTVQAMPSQISAFLFILRTSSKIYLRPKFYTTIQICYSWPCTMNSKHALCLDYCINSHSLPSRALISIYCKSNKFQWNSMLCGVSVKFFIRTFHLNLKQRVHHFGNLGPSNMNTQPSPISEFHQSWG